MVYTVAILGLGVAEIGIIAAVFVLLFGGAKFAQLGRGLGEGISNFRRGLSAGDEEKKS